MAFQVVDRPTNGPLILRMIHEELYALTGKWHLVLVLLLVLLDLVIRLMMILEEENLDHQYF